MPEHHFWWFYRHRDLQMDQLFLCNGFIIYFYHDTKTSKKYIECDILGHRKIAAQNQTKFDNSPWAIIYSHGGKFNKGLFNSLNNEIRHYKEAEISIANLKRAIDFAQNKGLLEEIYTTEGLPIIL